MIFVGVDPDTHDLPIAWIFFADVGGIPIPQGTLMIDMIHVPRTFKADQACALMARQLHHYGSEQAPKGCDILCVEAQHFSSKSRSRPQDIARLSVVAGAAGGAIKCRDLWLLPPVQWKGSVPKQIHQARIAKKLRWSVDPIGDLKTGYCAPRDPEILALLPKHSDWKHAFDAIGLALWALENWEKRR